MNEIDTDDTYTQITPAQHYFQGKASKIIKIKLNFDMKMKKKRVNREHL